VNLRYKSILITGSNGFIGRNLVKRLKKEGALITTIDNLSSSKAGSSYIDYIMDVSSKEFLDQRFNVDYVVHLASPCSVLQFNNSPIFSLNNSIQGFYNILKVTKRNKAKLIFPSSGNVYGNISIPFKENNDPRPNNLYAISKYTMEKMAYLSGVDFVALRIFAGYGPLEEEKGELMSVVTKFIINILKDQRPIVWGNGEQARDFVFIDDVVEAFIKSMKYRTPRILNVGSGRMTNYNELIKTINKILEKNITPKYIEKPSFYINQTLADITKMQKYLDLKITSLENGIRKTVKHLKSLDEI